MGSRSSWTQDSGSGVLGCVIIGIRTCYRIEDFQFRGCRIEGLG